jgi:hypothetical protein
VIFTDNYVERCADDGVSISRGCKRVVCANNVMRDIANSGIWISGWNQGPAAPGPDWFSCTGNTITNCGQAGIFLTSGPRYGVVSGNLIDTVHRGALDSPHDIWGNGIEITGYIYTYSTSAGLTQPATAINVVGNVIRNVENSGIYVLSAANNIHIANNQVIDFGSQFLADGTTAILTSDGQYNNGVTLDFGTQATSNIYDVSIVNNKFMDTRGTPFSNNPVREWGGPFVRTIRHGNISRGTRVASTEGVINYSRSGAGETAAEAALRTALAALGLISDQTTT